MRYRRKKKLNRKSILLYIVIIVIILFITFSVTLKNNYNLNYFESFVKDSVSYTEKVVTSPIKFIINKAKNYQKLSYTRRENDNLKRFVDRTDAIETENVELRRQIEKLKEELDIDYALTDYDYLNATIISRNIGFWHNIVTIDKGKFNGIEKDMVVINKKGLVGKIVKTTTFTSDVRLLTTSDTNNKISVSINSNDNNLYGVISSFDYKNNLLVVEGISNTEDVLIGDKVTTSGFGGIFPSGILIGYVEDIKKDSYDLAKIIKVKPSVSFDDINYVTVLRREVK